MLESEIEAVLSLRSAYQPDELIDELRKTSYEARAEKIAEALRAVAWAGHGKSLRLVATYPTGGLAISEDARLFRFQVEEQDGEIRLGSYTEFDTKKPLRPLGAEIFEAAKEAVSALLEGDMEKTDRLLKAVASVTSLSGPLRERVDVELARRFLGRAAWWHDLVRQEGLVPSKKIALEGDVLTRAATIRRKIAEIAVAVSADAQKIAEEESLPYGIREAVQDIVSDIERATLVAAKIPECGDFEEMERAIGSLADVLPLLEAGRAALQKLTTTSQPRAEERSEAV